MGLSAIAGFTRVAPVQGPVRRALRVEVTDSAGVPVPGANLVVLTAFRDTLGRGVTGDDGRALVPVDSGRGERQLVVRRIGFARADRVFRFAAADTPTVVVALRRAAQAVAAVTVEARRRVPYDFVAADEIDSMSTHRTLYNALDVVWKLRPEMANGWRCGSLPPRLSAVTADRRATVARFRAAGAGITVWVNGRREYWPGLGPDSVLAMIHAEHVSEIKYENCASRVVNRIGGDNAIFVALKPGVAFDVKHGSFAVNADSMIRAINRKP